MKVSASCECDRCGVSKPARRSQRRTRTGFNPPEGWRNERTPKGYKTFCVSCLEGFETIRSDYAFAYHKWVTDTNHPTNEGNTT